MCVDRGWRKEFWPLKDPGLGRVQSMQGGGSYHGSAKTWTNRECGQLSGLLERMCLSVT